MNTQVPTDYYEVNRNYW